MKGEFTLKGLDAYLEDLVRADHDVDQVVADVLTQAAPTVEEKMQALLRQTSEQWTGATAATVFAGPVQHDGNFIFIEAGANTQKDPAGFYKEYGTARQVAEPFIRPAFRELRRTGIKRMLKQVLEQFGLKV